MYFCFQWWFSPPIQSQELITSRGDFAPRLLELVQQMLKLGWVQADPTGTRTEENGFLVKKPWENDGRQQGKA